MRRGNQSAELCPIVNGVDDPSILSKHMWLFCDACRDRRLLNSVVGKQLISLLGESDSETEPTDVVERERESTGGKSFEGKKSGFDGKKKERKKKSERVEGFVPDALKISRLVKTGLTKAEALQKLVEEKRETAAQRLMEKSKAIGGKANDMEENTEAKLKVDPLNMPWTPRYDRFIISRPSVLNRVVDHQRYVAIISNFLDANKNVRYDHNKQEIEACFSSAMDQKLAEERKAYQKHVKKKMKTLKHELYVCGNLQTTRFVLERLTKRRSHLSGQYGSALKATEESYMEESTVLPKVKYNLVSGAMPKIVLPNERRRFAFTNDVNEVREQFPLEKVDQFPIEEDELAFHFAMKYAVNVVMGVSSALAIMCRRWLADSAKYVMPVVVKSRFDAVQGRSKNVCVVGKPCVFDELNYPSVWRRFVKHSVRVALYPKSKPSQRTGGRQRALFKKSGAATQQKLGDSTGKKEQSSASTEHESDDEIGDLVIAETAEIDARLRTENSASQHETEESTTKNNTDPQLVDDVLSGIMKEMGSADTITSRNEFEVNCAGAVEQQGDLEKFKGGDLSKRYSIFLVGGEVTDAIGFLIRSSNDGVDSSTGSSVSLAVKVEFAPDYGAEVLDDEEWLYDVLRCNFKCASHLLRLRVHYSELHFLQKERYEGRSMIARDARRKILLQKRTQLLKSVLVQLEQLKPGSYALRMDNKGHAEILPQITDPVSELVELDMDKVEEIKPCRATGYAFNGIDEHVALVYHLIQKRIPAALLPEKLKFRKGGESGGTGVEAPSSGTARKERQRGRKGGRKWSNPPAKRERIDFDAPQ
ncbi:unnamed protein product [Toxocara canis]|uniref:NARG2_C domain-containing protein n=1 Tax=Toxocara canis TaxID=6265 RepID=A0A183UPR7_TOXCA|nr:unnamed protein product [Toxocara canis]